MKTIVPETLKQGSLKTTSTNKFSLYPNPNDGQFFIDLKSTYKQAELTLSDITGRVMTTQQFQGVSVVPVHLQEGPGVYLVSVRVGWSFEVLKVVTY